MDKRKKGDPSVSVDILVKSLLDMGVNKKVGGIGKKVRGGKLSRSDFVHLQPVSDMMLKYGKTTKVLTSLVFIGYSKCICIF